MASHLLVLFPLPMLRSFAADVLLTVAGNGP